MARNKRSTARGKATSNCRTDIARELRGTDYLLGDYWLKLTENGVLVVRAREKLTVGPGDNSSAVRLVQQVGGNVLLEHLP